MEKKNIVKESKIKLNVDFICFVERVMKEKLLVKSKEELKKIYKEMVKVKSVNNINRVYERVKREKLKEILNKVLLDKKISFEEFEKVGNSIVSKIKEKKISNYISLKE